MAPNLRSVFAQVHRKSLSIGSRRNFSSENASKGAADEAKPLPCGVRRRVVWFLTQGVSGFAGFYWGNSIFGDRVAQFKEKEEQSKREFMEVQEMYGWK